MIGTRLIGGLGNQLFQSAMIFSYGKKHFVNYFLPETVINPHVPGKPAYKFPGFVYSSQPHNLEEYKEKSFRYELLPPMDNVCFHGYWQSWKYFDEHRNELLEAIGFPYKREERVVAMHIRRGDFLNYPDHHPPVTKEYIAKATEFFKQRGHFHFKVFSDDPQWCVENIMDEKSTYEFSENQDEVQDLIDMSCCSHQLCSNSSYSWWGYYLNRNKYKIGLFPRRWFGEMLPHDIQDLILPNSILM